jgi:hypothetical protein
MVAMVVTIGFYQNNSSIEATGTVVEASSVSVKHLSYLLFSFDA